MNVDDIRRVAVVGGGLMGSGLAQEFATAGYDVNLQDIDDGQLKAAIERIRENLAMLAAHGLVEAASIEAIVGRVTCTLALADAVSAADLVIEAAVETVEIKQGLFRSLSELCPAHAILASTTSAIHPDILAEATDCPDRVIVAHFGFPNYLLPLVEMARAAKTSDETATTVYALLENMGKRPIIMKKPLQGFIVNRLQMALMREALNIVSQGAARPEDIDIAVQNSFGRRYAVSGPLAVFDMTGLIVLMNVAKQTVPHLATTDEPFDYIREKVAAGNLGPSTGEGIYQWSPDSVAALRRHLTEGLIAVEKWTREQGGPPA
jgi:3-hydroxybutyryl-CoA dehydrogenase